jgi:hypothetical protein
MSLTKEAIEAARKTIFDELTYHGADDSSTLDAIERLDALCEAARQPDADETAATFERWVDNSPEWKEQIDRFRDTGVRQLVRRSMQAAWNAARQQGSLVGRRVWMKDDEEIVSITGGPFVSYAVKIEDSGGDYFIDVRRDDFEPLEDTDGK